MQIFAPRPIGFILTGFLAWLSWPHGRGRLELQDAWLNVQAHDLDRDNRLGDSGTDFQLAGVLQQLLITFFNLLLNLLAVLPGQSQDKEMLASPITFQGFGDRFFSGLDASVPVLSQSQWVSLAI